jgi:hypothetical protein
MGVRRYHAPHRPHSPRYNKNIGGPPTFKQIPFRLAEPDISALQCAPQAPRREIQLPTIQQTNVGDESCRSRRVLSLCVCAASAFYIQLCVCSLSFDATRICALAGRKGITSEFVNTRNSQEREEKTI